MINLLIDHPFHPWTSKVLRSTWISIVWGKCSTSVVVQTLLDPCRNVCYYALSRDTQRLSAHRSWVLYLRQYPFISISTLVKTKQITKFGLAFNRLRAIGKGYILFHFAAGHTESSSQFMTRHMKSSKKSSSRSWLLLASSCSSVNMSS